ncbi:NAD-dependent dehydratase [Chitinophaga caeni]|uniref:NAD-dependent dehydratase n=1 Tax=Chitinophaga caeni TaxID=2029983 RepID=A0A291R031_9BACT|nr:NAD-dependent epimerase/dehydratase family protein [Chitinophaga caeni]ATL49560.1 NAD-dependent dehydratase [Chitinophaga caeni]
MQTILGAGGIIGIELAKALTQYTTDIRIVARNPQKVNETDQVFKADLLNPGETFRAIEGSEVVYLTVGLKYQAKVWQEQWPILMQNVINACIRTGAKLVFFDNVYMYGKVDGWMTEESIMRPNSKKGKVRTRLISMLQDEMHKNTFPILIARSVDFYGPGTKNSVTNLIFDNIRDGKKPQWLVDINVPHSLTYTPDAGKATALLGNTPDAYNQIWHLPTDPEKITMKSFIHQALEAAGLPQKIGIFPPWLLTIAGLFNTNIREIKEMLYQYDSPYLFDSSKFEKRFGKMYTPYSEGIQYMIQYNRQKR